MKNTIILITGFSGSGKYTIAKSLVDQDQSFKLVDTQRAIELSEQREVFHFNHSNEFTLDVTSLSAIQAAGKILEYAKV